MKFLKALAIVYIVVLATSCSSNEPENQIEDLLNGEDTVEVLDEELKAGVQFDVSTIIVPENFNQTEPGLQLFAVETLLSAQAPLLIIDDTSTVESISILDDTLYYTRTDGNDCGLPTDIYTHRYQWEVLGFTYTTELGQNDGYNFWITEYKGEENGEINSVTIFGREERGEEVSGCVFVSANEESNAKLEWYVSTGGVSEGDTVIRYTLYDGEDRQVTLMTFKEDGSGRSRVTVIDSSETTTEDISYRWTIDGEVTSF